MSKPSPSRAPLALALLALLASVVPFLGLTGIVPIILLRRQAQRSSWWSRATFVASAFAVAIGLFWCVVYVEAPRPIVRAESPFVSSVDGQGVTVEGSFVSGALYPWAERHDVLRAAHLGAAADAHVLRIDGVAGETFLVDSASLLVAEHEPSVEIIPTTTQTLVGIRDGDAVVASPLVSTDSALGGEPTRTWRLSFPGFSRSVSARAVLVITARTTAFAEDAFARYLGTMGQSMEPFMASVTKETCSDACRQEVWDDETERLGIPLVVQPEHGARQLVAPVGSRGMRRFGVVLDVPESTTAPLPLVVQLKATPGFWEIESVALAPTSEEVTADVIPPSSARLLRADSEQDVRDLVIESDRTRAAIHEHESLELRFPSRAPSSRMQSTFISLRGHYRVPVGGRRFLNLPAIAAHRARLTSLPRFAATLPRVDEQAK